MSKVLKGSEIFRFLAADREQKDARLAEITPEVALKLEALRAPYQRQISTTKKSYFVHVLKAGNFQTTHQGIAVDVDGLVFDGQKRLRAIVESGITATMMLAKGFTIEEAMAVDRGQTRSTADILTMSGEPVSRNLVALARKMYEGWRTNSDPNFGDYEARDFIQRYGDALRFAVAKQKKRGLSQAPVCAAVARAYLFEDRERLAEFLEVYHSGIYQSPKDTAAIRLRNYVLEDGSKLFGGSLRTALYKRAEYAIRHFLDRRPVTRLLEATEELWPMPHEKDDTTPLFRPRPEDSASPSSKKVARPRGTPFRPYGQ